MKRSTLPMTILLAVALHGLAAPRVEEVESETIRSVYELEAMLIDAQYSIIGISPQSEYTYWETPNHVVPVDFAKFPKRFKKLSYAELDGNLMPIYRIAIYEDYVT